MLMKIEVWGGIKRFVQDAAIGCETTGHREIRVLSTGVGYAGRQACRRSEMMKIFFRGFPLLLVA
jgi:hypothetical protein